jgi:hypothetical protein
MNKYEKQCKKAYDEYVREKKVYDLTYVTPPPPKDYKSIANFGLPKEERKFKHHSREMMKILDGEDRLSFIDREMERRYLGYWFYNGDKLEYLTGYNYIFLQYGSVDDHGDDNSIRPKFIDAQRDFFYAWQWTDEEKKCAGLVVATMRRFGKTILSLSIIYEKAIRKYNQRVGIQSKTREDGKSVFIKLMYMWQKMASFLSPVTTGNARKESKMVFSNPHHVKVLKEALDSEITYKSSDEIGYDGEKLNIVYNDEIGKAPDIDVYKRWLVQRECLKRGTTLVGKSLNTTTVEEMESGGGKQFKEWWDKSDWKRVIEGEVPVTSSECARVFFPADYGYEGEHILTGEKFIDDWGYSNRAVARNHHEYVRSTLSGEDLASYKRKYPLEEADMFIFPDTESPFSMYRLDAQQKYNDDNQVGRQIRRGNFYWNGGIDNGFVEFHDSDFGRWFIYAMPQENDRNQKMKMGGSMFYQPMRRKFFMGVDPTDHKSPVSGKGSNNAAYVVDSAGYPVAQYVNRSVDPAQFYEDMLMASVFYSAYTLIEDNKPGIMTHYEQRGFYSYLLYNPFETNLKKKFSKPGFPNSDGNNRTELIDHAVIWTINHVGYLPTNEYGRFPFNELITDMKGFNKQKWTPHDETVAFMLALGATKDPPDIYEPQPEDTQQQTLLRTYRLG